MNNQELTVVNIFTNRKNDTNSSPHIQIPLLFTHLYQKLYIYTSTILKKQASCKLKVYTSVLIYVIMQTMKNTVGNSVLKELPLRKNKESAEKGLQETKRRAKGRQSKQRPSSSEEL